MFSPVPFSFSYTAASKGKPDADEPLPVAMEIFFKPRPVGAASVAVLKPERDP